jgi:hypothetical protein
MDPSFSIDLKTITGIVALTIAIVHYLKGWLASVPGLEKLPVAAYVVLVSASLTLLSRDVLHLIGGDRGELLMQAIIQALVASGAVEWWRAGAKPLEDSQRAQDVTMKRGGFYLLPILLAVGLAAGCAGKSKAIAVQADATVVSILTGVQSSADQLLASGAITVETRRAIAPYLLKALQLGDNFNRAARAGASFAAIAELLDALRTLKVQLSTLLPASLGGNLAAQVERAIGLVPATSGGR